MNNLPCADLLPTDPVTPTAITTRIYMGQVVYMEASLVKLAEDKVGILFIKFPIRHMLDENI